MKKIFFLTASLILLTGCVESLALLGPATSALGGGNVIHSSVSSATTYAVKRTTGKSPMQHALAYASEKNPNKKKDRCLSFVKKTESEACYIAKKQLSSVKKNTLKKIKNVIKTPKSKIVKKIKKGQKIVTQVEEEKKINSLQVKEKKMYSLQIKEKKMYSLQIKEKKMYSLQVKEKKIPKLISVESMLLETARSKKQINHLQVSIDKSLNIKKLKN